MSKERYNQIIDEVYMKALMKYGFNWLPGTPPSTYLETQEIFINKCKTDPEFSEKWGLKIEEQLLSEERRYNIWFNNNYETGMERFFNPEQLPDYDNSYYVPTPTKEITISYNGEKISFYE
ncbi:MAG: hypothetical protein RIR48_1538 [Bacteroidota bacterium]